MPKIHQPYKSKPIFAFTSIGALLLGSGIIIASPAIHPSSRAYAAGDSRTIHDISNMQDMTQQICSNTDENDTAVLTDNRNGYSAGTMTGSDDSTHNLNQYVVVKLKDGNCWMQENLRTNLVENTTIEGSTENGDPYSWTVPNGATTQASNTATWTGEYTTVMSRIGTVENGNYYTWCAATAGTCSDVASDGAVASASICPKGWHLPTGGGSDSTGTGEFGTLLNKVGSPAIAELPYNFSYAGYINSTDGLLHYAGSSGRYWSITSRSSTRAYNLGFNHNGNFDSGTGLSARYYGYSVRCLALGGLPKIEQPIWSETEYGNVNVTMPTVITIDAASGMQGTAAANTITEGIIIAKVTSNGEHKVSLSATEPALKDPKVPTAEISPASSTNPVRPGNNAWGIWNGNTNIYDPITKEAKTYNETITNGVDGQKIHTYQVGISISPALPAGTYATEVTVTASAK